MKDRNRLLYRISQFAGLLLGARVFVLLFFAFTLYVSTFFLFSQEESLYRFVFDYKVHGIIFCSILSIAAGSIINHFYDQEKDRLQRPFRSRLQNFIKQKYFLYSYIFLNLLSLGIALWLSPRIFIFFFIYQFLMWMYSHRISKILILNNIAYVCLTLYPFFGMLVYYSHFSWTLFLMASYLSLVLLIIDVLKDILTVRVDKIFNYNTIATSFGINGSIRMLMVTFIVSAGVSLLAAGRLPPSSVLSLYYSASAIVLVVGLYPMLFFKLKNISWLRNGLRLWIVTGVFCMLLNGLLQRF